MTRVARPVLVLFTYRLVAGFVVAYPVARTLGAFGASSHPDGDLSLFAPGATHLLETLRLARRAAPAAVGSAGAVVAVLGLLGLVPFTVALAALSKPGARWAALAARAAECLPRLLLLGGGFVLLEGALVGILAVVTRMADALGESVADERAQTLAAALAGLPVVALVLALGVVHDLARAAVVHRDRLVLDAIGDALRAWRARPGTVLAGWLLPLLAAGATMGFAAWLTGVIDVARPGSWRVAAVLAVHQTTVLAMVALRVVWLARAIDLVAGSDRSPMGRATSDPEVPTSRPTTDGGGAGSG